MAEELGLELALYFALRPPGLEQLRHSREKASTPRTGRPHRVSVPGPETRTATTAQGGDGLSPTNALGTFSEPVPGSSTNSAAIVRLSVARGRWRRRWFALITFSLRSQRGAGDGVSLDEPVRSVLVRMTMYCAFARKSAASISNVSWAASSPGSIAPSAWASRTALSMRPSQPPRKATRWSRTGPGCRGGGSPRASQGRALGARRSACRHEPRVSSTFERVRPVV